MFSSYSRPGFWCVTLIGISAQSGGNSWAMANPLNAPPQLSIPYVVPKQLWDVGWIEGCFDKGISSFVYRRRTGFSEVTFLKVGWVKISKFLPRGLTQGELGKIEPTGVPLEVWAGFGIGMVLAPKFPYVVSIYQPRILGILRIPQILRTPARASHSTAGEVHILSNHRARQDLRTP